jgi:hypothetical protein
MTEIMEDQTGARYAARVKAQGGLQALGKDGKVRVAGFVQESIALGNGVGTTRDDAMVEGTDGKVRLYTTAARAITAAEIHTAIEGKSSLLTVTDWMMMKAEKVADILLACAGKDAEYLNAYFIAEYTAHRTAAADKKSAKEWENGSPKVVLASVLEQVSALKAREDWDANDYVQFDAVQKAVEELNEIISGN